MKAKLKHLAEADGFSLVELIVTIAIIVVLVSILVPNVAVYISQATKAQTEATAKELFSAASVYVSEELAKGNEFTADEVIDPEILWMQDDSLVDEPKGYDEIEIKLTSNGANINYVYLRKGDYEADYPRGNSGKIAYDDLP